MSVVTLCDVRFTHGGAQVPALDGISLDIRAGEILLLEGPSGSGKSTLLRAIAGLVPHFHGGRFEGRIDVLGIDTRRAGVGRLARTVGILFQDPETQAVRSTVASDVGFAPENLGVEVADIPGRVERALASARATHLADRDVTRISGGERQRAALAAVLAAEPRVLLLDEPTSQLDAPAVRALDEVLREQAARGVAVVVAEHHADRLATAPDRIVRLDGGRVVARREMPPLDSPRAPDMAGPPLLVCDVLYASIAGRQVLRGCSIAIHEGTVTVIRGDNGAGKSTLLRVIAGLHAPDRGSLRLAGHEIVDRPTEERVPTIGFLAQDAGRRLIHERVRDELASGAIGVGGLELDRRLERVADELDIEPLLARHPLDLSVGERERVAIGVVLMGEPRLIMLDEPTRGMDSARGARLVELLRRRAASGVAVVVATHDGRFADAVGDVHLSMRDGVFTRDVAAVPS